MESPQHTLHLFTVVVLLQRRYCDDLQAQIYAWETYGGFFFLAASFGFSDYA